MLKGSVAERISIKVIFMVKRVSDNIIQFDFECNLFPTALVYLDLVTVTC